MSVLPIGAEVNGLRVEAVAATGGNSIVYRVREVDSGHERALKVLRGPVDDRTRRRFAREAQLLERAQHPGVVRLWSHGERDGDLHLVTDWVSGRTLADHLGLRGSLSVDETLAILDQLAAPLDALHAEGILHRDLTPANVMIADDGRVTIIDLGIGHEVDAATMTRDDLVAGTPRFLAPEIVRGDGATARSDQYSVAMMLWEMLAGRPALPEADQIATALHHQLHTVPDPVDEVNPSVPLSFSSALGRALAKDPDERFGSVSDLAAAARAPLPGTSPVRAKVPVMVAAALLMVVLGAVWIGTRGDAPSGGQSVAVVPVPTDTAATEIPAAADSDVAAPVLELWVAGTAASLQCNLLTGIDFEDGVIPVDFYGLPAGVERVIDHGGFDDSAVLEIGQAGQFSQYAEWVPVVPGGSYVFRGWFRRTGDVAAAELGVSFLDASDQGIGDSVKVELFGTDAGFTEVRVDAAPAGAVFALPYLYKDSSQEVLLADELVFGPTARCEEEFANYEEEQQG